MNKNKEARDLMILEHTSNKANYSDPYELAMYAADMLELWEKMENYTIMPEWLVKEAEDIWGPRDTE